MKTIIYYFTGTGNSLKIARDLANELGDAEIIPIAKMTNGSVMPSTERVGIIYPVYMWGMPLIVNRFIEKLKTDKYIFAIANCGGMAAGALCKTAKQLKAQGMKLSAGFIVVMPGNYIPMYGAQPEEKQQKLFAKTAGRIKEIAKIIREGKETKTEKGSFLSNWIFSGIIYNLGSGKIPVGDKSFWVNDKCNSCGTCAKVCPVKNIIMTNGKPVWQNKCEQCLACLQWCPTEAIQFGKNTEGRKRYRNPSIKLSDML